MSCPPFSLFMVPGGGPHYLIMLMLSVLWVLHCWPFCNALYIALGLAKYILMPCHGVKCKAE